MPTAPPRVRTPARQPPTSADRSTAVEGRRWWAIFVVTLIGVIVASIGVTVQVASVSSGHQQSTGSSDHGGASNDHGGQSKAPGSGAVGAGPVRVGNGYLSEALPVANAPSGLTLELFAGRQDAIAAANTTVPFHWASPNDSGSCRLTVIAKGTAASQAELYGALPGWRAAEWDPDHQDLARLGVAHQQSLALPQNATVGTSWLGSPLIDVDGVRYSASSFRVALTSLTDGRATLTIDGATVTCTI